MKKLSFSLLCAMMALSSFCQPGANDPTFNVNDIGNGFGDWFNGIVTSMVRQPDGKIIAIGGFSNYNGTSASRIVRINPDGTADNTFQIGSGFNDDVYAIALQPDGKIVVGGEFRGYNNKIALNVARLNTDGTQDNTFATSPLAGAAVIRAIAVQADGKIVLGGELTGKRIARLNSDGTLDTSFAADIASSFSPTISDIGITAEGKIVCVGLFSTVNGTTRNNIAQLNSDGSLDISFDPGTGFHAITDGMQVKVQSTGKIIVVGGFDSFNGFNVSRMVRLTATGAYEASMSPPVDLNVGMAYDVDTDVDGNIYIAGEFDYSGGAKRNVLRLFANGLPDVAFTPPGDFDREVRTIVVEPSGELVIAGGFEFINNKSRKRIARLVATGQLDNNGFNTPGTGIDTKPSTIAMQPDGKFLISGSFTSVNGTEAKGIARMNADGSVDNTFHIDAAPGDVNYIFAMAVQPADGKIVIGGNFRDEGGNYLPSIRRLNPDGSWDNTFTLTSQTSDIYRIAVQADGKIIVAGRIDNVNGAVIGHIIRLNTDGSTDATFSASANGKITAMDIQPDNKIVIGGHFTQLNGAPAARFARINANGTTDNTFNTGTGVSGTLSDVALLPDGKIMMLGYFESYNGVTRRSLARVNGDGSIDEDFNANEEFFSPYILNDMIVQPDGKIVVAGEFSQVSAFVIQRIARFHKNGKRDNSFAVSTGFNKPVNKLELVADGKILAVGDFTQYNNAGRNRIVRIFGGGIKADFNPGSLCAGQTVQIPFTITGAHNFTAGNVFTAQISNDLGVFQSQLNMGAINGTTNGTIEAVIPANTPAGKKYKVRVISSQPGITGDDNGFDIEVNAAAVGAGTSKSPICEGETVTLTAHSANTYVWNNGAGQTASVDVSPETTTTYTVTGTLSNGCTATASVTIIVNPKPVTPEIETDMADPSAPVLSITDETSHFWYKDGNIISSDGNNTITVTDNGSYTVTTKSDNGCISEISEAVVITITALEENSATVFSMYPNPAASHVMIQLKGFSDESAVNISVVDALGRVLNTQKVDGSTKELTMDVSEYRAGNYRVIFRQEKMLVSRQLVKR